MNKTSPQRIAVRAYCESLGATHLLGDTDRRLTEQGNTSDHHHTNYEVWADDFTASRHILARIFDDLWICERLGQLRRVSIEDSHIHIAGYSQAPTPPRRPWWRPLRRGAVR